jgi:hypothetical protein
MNPIHARFRTPRLWEAEGEVGLRDGQIKCGCKTLTTIREIPLPSITTEMRVRFAILCAKEVCACLSWNAWADRWLSGEDRSEAAAGAAAEAAWAATWAAEATAWAAEAASAAYRSVAYLSAAASWASAAASWASEAAAAWASEAAWTNVGKAAAEAASAAYRSVAYLSAAAWAARAGTDIFAIAEKACSGVHTFEEIQKADRAQKGSAL